MRIIIEMDSNEVTVTTAEAPREGGRSRAQPPRNSAAEAGVSGAIDAGPAPSPEELGGRPPAFDVRPTAVIETFDAGEAPRRKREQR